VKKIIWFFVIIAFTSCKDDSDCCVNLEPVNVTLKFTHNWDGTPVTASDFNSFNYVTENGESVSIERLRYVLSNILFNNNVQGSNLYKLIDLNNNDTEIIIKNIPLININSLSFTFGFSDADNIDGIYQDLNTASFNVPSMLGGGYHYMQFDGKYKDTNNLDANFNYHAIRAVNRSDPNNLIFEDTSFLVDFGSVTITNNATIEIKMNIAEWFKNPNTWDLNQLNTVLMPNFEAQKLISANGKSVFSLGDILQ
jgi:hypothetical protein